MMHVNFGPLSAEETQSIAIEAMSNLSTDQKIEVVKRLFRDADDKAELIAQLED